MTYKQVPPTTKDDLIARDFYLDLPNGAIANVNLYSSDGTCMSGSVVLGNTKIYIEPNYKQRTFKQNIGLIAAFTKKNDGEIVKLDKSEIGIDEINAKVLEILNNDDELKDELEKLNSLVNKRMVINELADIDIKIEQLQKKRVEVATKLNVSFNG